MSNFNGYHKAKLNSRAEIISRCLATLAKQKSKEKNKTTLAKKLIDMVYQIELENYILAQEQDEQHKLKKPKRMSVDTLTRKDGNYLHLLLTHLSENDSEQGVLAMHPTKGSIKDQAVIAQKKAANITLVNKITYLEGIVGKLEKENERLNAFVVNYYGGRQALGHDSCDNASNDDLEACNSKLESEVSDLVKSIIQITSKCEYLDIDFVNKTIMDITKVRQRNALVDSELLEAFFKHLEMMNSHDGEML